MTKHIIALGLIVASTACGPSDADRAAAHVVLTGLADCLDRVVDGIGTGTFDPQYAGCVELHLSRDSASGGFSALTRAAAAEPVRRLLTDREAEFQRHVEQANETAGPGRQAALLTYQLALADTANQLRSLR